MKTFESHGLTRVVLMVLFILALMISSFRILTPFLLAVVWASTIVIATWPLLLRIEAMLGKRRGAAVAVMVSVTLLAFVLPIGLTLDSILSNRETISGWLAALPTMTLPASPAWVYQIPLVGAKIAAAWDDLAAAGTQAIFVRLAPYTNDLFAWVLSRAGALGAASIQFLLTVAIAGILYSKGELAAAGVIRFARRLGGENGESAIRLAAQSVRAVALGVIVTALAESILAWIGLAITGVPFAPILTAVIFVLCIAQVGPILVMIPATLWLYSQGESVWGTVLLVWTVALAVMDNFLKPMLIKRGADLPILLIFAGVIGGLLAFGVIGLFVGPVVLAVTYTLLQRWVDTGSEKQASENASPA
jgi:predicted PurR-regulated permease PerM